MNIESVYTDDHTIVNVKREIKYKKFGYVYRIESVQYSESEEPTELKVCYDMNGLYLGNNKIANFLCRRKGLSQFEPSSTGKVASIGFNKKEQQWYGWSHRAIYGFGVGSTVKSGDCGYIPANKEDMAKEMCDFWEIGKTLEAESLSTTCTRVLESIEYDYVHREKYYRCSLSDEELEEGPEQIGIMLKYRTEYSNPNRETLNSEHFEPYPKEWKGEWTAKTLDDAKQMAKDFASGVS